MHTRWYRTGVFYSLDVGLFQDSNDDGVGDFQGLIARLDYLARLGVTLIWLNPFTRRRGGTAGTTSSTITTSTSDWAVSATSPR